MRTLSDERGLALLYTVLLVPTFLLLLALVVEVGAVRVARARLLAAADVAATTATIEQDIAALAADGRYRLAPTAAGVARETLASNLQPMAALLAGSPESIASAADIRVDAGEMPPLVRVSFRAPIRTPLLLLAGLSDSTSISISSTAAPR